MVSSGRQELWEDGIGDAVTVSKSFLVLPSSFLTMWFITLKKLGLSLFFTTSPACKEVTLVGGFTWEKSNNITPHWPKTLSMQVSQCWFQNWFNQGVGKGHIPNQDCLLTLPWVGNWGSSALFWIGNRNVTMIQGTNSNRSFPKRLNMWKNHFILFIKHLRVLLVVDHPWSAVFEDKKLGLRESEQFIQGHKVKQRQNSGKQF